MADPSMRVRTGTYERDAWRCVACGKRQQITYQHRHTEGMGGSAAEPEFSHGIVLCLRCNTEVEASLQAQGYMFGWKVRHHVNPLLVPVFYAFERSWFVLYDDAPRRAPVTARRARELMDAAYQSGGPGAA